MKRLWEVARYEYRRNVFKKSFILLMISVPVFITFSLGLGFFMESVDTNELPVGYVDLAGVIHAGRAAEANAGWAEAGNDRVAFIAFPSEEAAGAALEEGAIQMFYVLREDYAETRSMEQVFIEEPGRNAAWQVYDFMRFQLLSGQSPEVASRVASGTGVTVRSIDGLRRVPSGGPTFGLMMPLFITMAFLFMILMSSGFTMSSVADEKENRTIEVLVTRISTNSLVAGKIIGIVGIGLTLLFSWTLVTLIGIGVARGQGIAFFQDLGLDWRTILGTLAIAVPTYALAIALMTAIGAMVTTTQEGQSVSSIFFILHLLPLYVSWGLINNPHNTLGITLSLLPFTSLMTVGMRNLFTIVPAWQIWVSMLVQTLGALGAMWLAGRSLRLGMLRYGQRLAWRKLFRPAN